MIMVGILLGVGSALWAVKLHRLPRAQMGAWSFDPTKRMKRDSIYSNAAATRYGILAAAPTEALYLSAKVDDNGQSLRGDVDYVIQGTALPTRWWSLNVYGEEGFLIENSINRTGYHSEDVQWEPDNTFTIYVGPTPKEGNWIQTNHEKSVDFYLRLYQPEASLLKQITSIKYPSIRAVEVASE
jgi:hypothetical protein